MFSRLKKGVKGTSKKSSVMPWDNPEAQAPPLPTCYANWSPSSTRKAMKPATAITQIPEPTPNPVHFNRPSPAMAITQIPEPAPNPLHFNRPSPAASPVTTSTSNQHQQPAPATSPLTTRKNKSGSSDDIQQQALKEISNETYGENNIWKSPVCGKKTYDREDNLGQFPDRLSQSGRDYEQSAKTTQPSQTTKDIDRLSNIQYTKQEKQVYSTPNQQENNDVPWRSPEAKRKKIHEANTKQKKSEAKNAPTVDAKTSPLESLNTQDENKPHKDFKDQSFGKVYDKQSSFLKEKTMSLHNIQRNGLEANSHSTASMSYSYSSQSVSKTSESSFAVKSSLSEMSNVLTKVSSSEGFVETKSDETVSTLAGQSPTPWRRGKMSEVSAKDQTSSHKAGWGQERETVSASADSKAMIRTNVDDSSVHSKEPQQQIQQQQQSHQKQQQEEKTQLSETVLAQQGSQHMEHQQKVVQQQSSPQDVPWRSPQLKKKEFSSTQCPAFINLSQQTFTTQTKQQTQTKTSEESDRKNKENTAVQSDHAETVKSCKSTSASGKVTIASTEQKTQIAPECEPTVPTTSAISGQMNKPVIQPQPTSQLPPKHPSSLKEVSNKDSLETSIDKEENKGAAKISIETTATNDLNQPQQHPTEEQSEIFTKSELPTPPLTTHEQETVSQISHGINDQVAQLPPLPPPPPSFPLFLNKTEEAPSLSSEFPPPPGNLALTMGPIPSPHDEATSPEYIQEPITSRIQKFEKQASLEGERKEKEAPPPAKPVGPWVKKTSSGPVQQDAWDHVPTESMIPTPRRIPDIQSKVSKSPQKQISGDSSVSSVTMTVSQPTKKQEKLQPQQKLLLKPQERLRTRSQGDIAYSYLDPDAFKMPSTKEGGVSLLALNGSPTTTKCGPSLADPFCDPENPKTILFQDISAAAFKIKSGIMNTPCTRSNMSRIVDMDVFFKKEFNQYTGSFKERGARYTLLCLSEEQKANGVIAASAGNHALALSYHGQDLGIPVTVVMPLVAPIMKVQACRQYGANVLVKGADIGECRQIALSMASEQDLLYINGYDHPNVLAGQGTMGLEIVEQVKDIDAVVVPTGGGGLIAGVALAVKSLYPKIKVIGAESERCASFSAALKANKPVYVKAESSLADGLAVPMVGVNAFATASKLIDKVVVVKEEWIAIAILRLVEMEKAVVEGAGAVALAALLAGELPELKGKRVVVPLCGGNIDTTVLGRCLERGLAADGRLVKFTVTVSDRPGGIAELTRMLANLGVSIKDMMHERAWIKSDIFSVEVTVVCETRDYEHMVDLKSAIEKRYKEFRISLPYHPVTKLL